MEAISVDTSDLTVTGDIDSLFSGGSVVQLSPAAPGGDLEIPINRDLLDRDLLPQVDGHYALASSAANGVYAIRRAVGLDCYRRY